MKQWILLGVLLCGAARAQSWQRLERVKAGATIVVETQPWRYAPVEVDRCELIGVAADTLTCVDFGRGRLVFPAREVNAVYEVRKTHVGLVAALLAICAAAGLVIAGAATDNPGAMLFGAVLGIVALTVSLHLPFAGPPFPGAPAPREHERLVYLRPAP